MNFDTMINQIGANMRLCNSATANSLLLPSQSVTLVFAFGLVKAVRGLESLDIKLERQEKSARL